MKATVVVLTQTTGFLNHLKPLLCYVMLYRPIYHRIASANQKAARNWRAKYQPISVQRGIRAQSISQSEGCQERRRTPTNQSACRNRANADQWERLQEHAEQGLGLTKTKATDTKNSHRSIKDMLIIAYAVPSNRVHRTSASVLRWHLTKSSHLIYMLLIQNGGGNSPQYLNVVSIICWKLCIFLNEPALFVSKLAYSVINHDCNRLLIKNEIILRHNGLYDSLWL